VRLNFRDHDAKIEVQAERVTGNDRWEADVLRMRRLVANQTRLRPSHQLQVFSH